MNSVQAKSATRLQLALVLLVAITSVFIIVYGAAGVRGTDQYWYLSDTNTLAQNKLPTTNIYYPGNMLRAGSMAATEPNYIMHNGPLLHLISWGSEAIGAYKAWIGANITSHLLVALSIWLIAMHYTTGSVSLAVTALYLVSPIAIWQSINMLQEQFYAVLLALIILGLLLARTKTTHLLTFLAITVGVLSHPIFLILGAFQCTWNLISGCVKNNRNSILLAVICGAFYLCVYRTKSALFPSSFQPNLAAIISGSVPDVSNMLWHYSDTHSAITPQFLWSKLLFAVKEHFLNLRSAPLYLYTNIAALLIPYLLFFRSRKPTTKVVLLCGTAMGAYAGMLILMQTQARYQQIIATATFVTIALVLNELYNQRHQTKLQKVIPSLVLAAIIGNILVSGFMANQARNQSRQEQSAMHKLTTEFAAIPLDARILLLDSNHELKLSYALRPRKVLTAKSAFIAQQSLDEAIRIFNPMYLLSTSKPKATLPGDLLRGSTTQIENKYLGDFYLSPL